MPKPHTQSLGRGRGTISIYPCHAREQLRALLEARAIYRKATDRAWALWWQGFKIPEAEIRGQLAALAAEWEADRTELATRGPEAVLDAAESLTVSSRIPRQLRRARRSLGREDFLTVMYSVGLVMSGSFECFPIDTVTGHSEVAELVSSAFGATGGLNVGAAPSTTSRFTADLQTITSMAAVPLGQLVETVPWNALCEVPAALRSMQNDLRSRDT